MKKRIWSLVLALCMLIMLIPPTAFAEQTDYKEIYFDFLKDELITKNTYHWGYATLADLNLDGTPELIMCDSGATVSCGLYIFQIIDNIVQLRYAGGYTWEEYVNKNYSINKDYFNSTISSEKLMANPLSYSSGGTYFSLRKNKYTDEVLYVLFSRAGGIDFNKETLLSFSKDEIFNASENFCSNVEKDEGTGDIVSSNYYIDSNTVSKEDYDAAYNEFIDTWQETDYEFPFLNCSEEVTEQKIRDFLNYYIPEKQFLGIADEEDANKYGYVDVMPISRQEYDDRYEIKVSYKNNSSKTITNKRIVLACTTMTNSKTKNQSEVVAAYKDSEDVFNPYEEKVVTTRIHCKKTADGIPYVIGDKPFSSNYRRYHSFLDDMTLITVQFANDKEYNDFMAEIEANHLTDLSTDEYIESNSMWLKTFKGDK